MKAKVIKKFKDLKEKKHREIGDTFEVSPTRLKEINSTRYGKLVAEVKEKK